MYEITVVDADSDVRFEARISRSSTHPCAVSAHVHSLPTLAHLSRFLVSISATSNLRKRVERVKKSR
jgi:hypothetical protein